MLTTDRSRAARRVVATIAAAVALSACGAGGGGSGVPSVGGGGASTTTPGSGRGEEGILAFERCMREHGVEMGGGDGAVARPGAGDRPDDPFDDPDFSKAETACRHLLGNVVISDGSTEPLDPAAKDAMVAYAKCMRGEGVDMPDPGDGGLVGDAGDDDVDPDSDEYRAADERCRHHLDGVEAEREDSRP